MAIARGWDRARRIRRDTVELAILGKRRRDERKFDAWVGALGAAGERESQQRKRSASHRIASSFDVHP
jgi:hypothetical protein